MKNLKLCTTTVSRKGGVDLSDQLLNYFTFLCKSTKLLIHLFQFGYTKSYAFNFRQEGLGTVVVQAAEGNDGVDDDDG